MPVELEVEVEEVEVEVEALDHLDPPVSCSVQEVKTFRSWQVWVLGVGQLGAHGHADFVF